MLWDILCHGAAGALFGLMVLLATAYTASRVQAWREGRFPRLPNPPPARQALTLLSEPTARFRNLVPCVNDRPFWGNAPGTVLLSSYTADADFIGGRLVVRHTFVLYFGGPWVTFPTADMTPVEAARVAPYEAWMENHPPEPLRGEPITTDALRELCAGAGTDGVKVEFDAEFGWRKV